MNFPRGWKALVGVGAGVVVVALVILWQGVEYYTSRSAFCGGNCHTMGEQYAAWQNSKHHGAKSAKGQQAECIDCHFVPGGKKTLQAKFIGLRHLAAYLADPKAHLPVRAKIPDGACLSCHDKGKLRDTPIKFAGKVDFKHGPHFDKPIEGQFDKPIEGQQIFCDTCHTKETKDKHFEVSPQTCFTCHFTVAQTTPSAAAVKPADAKPADGKLVPPVLKMAEFIKPAHGATTAAPLNQGRGKCATCHVIPTKSLQAQLQDNSPDRTPISHQTLMEAKVRCESCHFGVVQGNGAVQTAGCFSGCHSKSEDVLAKASDGKLMHERHTSTQRADCRDCHAPIVHAKPKDYLDPVRAECRLCHENSHEAQRILLAGLPVAKGIRGTPQLMDAVSTTCVACHIGEKRGRGHTVKIGSGEACASCHGEKHKKMVEDWKLLLDKEVGNLRKLEQDAEAAADKAKAAGKNVTEAMTMIAEARRLVDIVAFGNGVHNKKYAVMILDEASGRFEDAIQMLEKGG